MYDYETAVREDVQQAIEDNYTEDEIIQHLAEDRDEWEEKLYDDLWVDDSVTGNASGSYTFNSYEAEQNIAGNWGLLSEALDEFGESGADAIGNGAEWCDVTIRCYLLGGALSSVLDEYEERYADEIKAYQGE